MSGLTDCSGSTCSVWSKQPIQKTCNRSWYAQEIYLAIALQEKDEGHTDFYKMKYYLWFFLLLSGRYGTYGRHEL